MMRLLFVICIYSFGITISNASNTALPNIVLMMADDAGIETISSYGSNTFKTPNIDSIAAEGIRFTHTYSQPLCTPSRVKLMTGRHNFKNYKYFSFLDPNETTFANLLKTKGYKTMIAGKWQLYGDGVSPIPGSFPEQAGFDEHILWQVYRETRGKRYWHPTLTRNGEMKTYKPTDFGPDIMNDYVINFMERQHEAGEPFFVYYPLVLPHDPFVATPDFPDAKTDHEKFYAMISHMDKMVGNVQRKIDQLDIAENTLFIFISDNGTSRFITSYMNGIEVPGSKGLTNDAGHHVPFVAKWPGQIKSGSLSGNLVDFTDFLPTLLDVAQIEMPTNLDLDGQSLLPLLKGDDREIRDSAFIHYEPHWGIFSPARYEFDKRWKLYDDGRFFDLKNDIREESPLDISALDQAGRKAYDHLKSKLETRAGELTSRLDYDTLNKVEN